MTKYSARVMVEYVFDFDSEDLESNTFRDAENFAYYNFSQYPEYSDVYSVEISEEEEDEDE